MQRAICLLLILLGSVGLAHPAAAQAPPRYYALVVGNDDYAHLAKLRTPTRDASAITDALRNRYGFRVEQLLNATREQMISALNRLRGELSEKDNLLIYYAGHGYIDTASDTGFWLPVDAQPDNEVNWIPVSEVTRNLRVNSARHILVIADSCYSGTLTRSAVVKVPGNNDAWLERMASKRSRTALTSGGIEPVADGGTDGHSVFAKAFLDTLQANSEVMAGETLFARLRGAVVVKAPQTPQYSDIRNAGHDGGDFIFTPRPESAAVAKPAPAAPGATDRSLERDFWNAIKDSNDPAMFEAHIKEFPDGFLTPLARVKLKELTDRQQATRRPEIAMTPPPALPPPPKGPTIEDMEAQFEVVANANIREQPTGNSKRLGYLEKGHAVLVTGKLVDANWYRIETADGGVGFVFGESIRRPPARDVAAPVPPAVASAPAVAPPPPPVASPPVALPPPAPAASSAPPAPTDAAPQIATLPPPAAPKPPQPRGESFRDCEACPEMVALAPGAFVMGSNDGDPTEKPAHRVSIARPFALGRYAVTTAQWRACVTAGGCSYAPKADVPDDAPIHNVSWEDAQAYVRWLTTLTGKPYRLPSEAEWEYAARGGTTTKYWWGDQIGVAKANCRGCGGPWESARPAPVGSFPPNPFGLFDMNGGVAQWVADCWYPNHAGAPADGSARGGSCAHHVLRGGAWKNEPGYLRSSSRMDYDTGVRYLAHGFRIARSLD
jgi:formylglycine-generating enzyme required for sulfatase activity